MQNKKEFFGNGGTVAMYQNGTQYSVDSEIEQAPGIFKCTSVPFMTADAAQEYYVKCVKDVQDKKMTMAACGIFQKKH